jgi:hypothetical protein
VSRDGLIWRYNESNAAKWTGVPGALVQISVAVSGRRFQVWGVNSVGGIWFKDDVTPANPQGGAWVNIPGQAVHVSVGGGNVWCVNAGNQIYVRTGISQAARSGTGWQHVPGGLTQVSCGADGSVWGVMGKDNTIWRRTNVTAKNPAGDDWQQAPGGLTAIAAGSHHVAGCSHKQEIFHRSGLHASEHGDGWTQLPGAAVKCSVDSANGTWVVNVGGNLYHWPTHASSWRHVASAPAGLTSVGAGTSDLVFVTDGAQGIHVSSNSGHSWAVVPGQLCQIECGAY